MITSPDFKITVPAEAERVSFQFSVEGKKRAGVLYLSANLSGQGLMIDARKAACRICKRADAPYATLQAIVPPMR